MTTGYQDRELEHDLGDGHSFVWFRDEEGIFGLIEHHPPPEDAAKYCGGWVAWREPVHEVGIVPKHRLVTGGPGDEDVVTVEPSISCGVCGNHGYIRNGQWQRV